MSDLVNTSRINLTGRLYFGDGSYLASAPSVDTLKLAAINRNIETSTTSFGTDNIFTFGNVRSAQEVVADDAVRAKRIRFMDNDGQLVGTQSVPFDSDQIQRIATLESAAESANGTLSSHGGRIGDLEGELVRIDDLEGEMESANASITVHSQTITTIQGLISVLQQEAQELEDGTFVISPIVQAALDTLSSAIQLRALIADLPTKSSLGLGNVDNTSDVNKPVSSAVQTIVDSINSSITSLQSSSSSFASIASSLSADIFQLQQQITNGDSALSAIASGLQTSVDAINVLINALPTMADLPSKMSLGLDQVDNTADLDKPTSTSTYTLISALQDSIDVLSSSKMSLAGVQALGYIDNAALVTYVQSQIANLQNNEAVGAAIAAALANYEDIDGVTSAINAAVSGKASTQYVDSEIVSSLASYDSSAVQAMQAYVATQFSSELANVVSSSQLSTALQDYVSSSSLAGQMSGKVGSSELTSILLDYSTNAAVASSIASALSTYASQSYVVSALSSYMTSAQFSSAVESALTPYATISLVNSAIADALVAYLSSSQVMAEIASAIADKVTSSQLSDAVADLQSASQVQSSIATALAPFATSVAVSQAIASAIAAIPSSDFDSSAAQALIDSSLVGYVQGSEVDSAIADALVPYSSTSAMDQAISTAIAAIPTNSFGSTDAQALIDSSLVDYYDKTEMDTSLATKASTSALNEVGSRVTASETAIITLQSAPAAIPFTRVDGVIENGPNYTGTSGYTKMGHVIIPTPGKYMVYARGTPRASVNASGMLIVRCFRHGTASFTTGANGYLVGYNHTQTGVAINTANYPVSGCIGNAFNVYLPTSNPALYYSFSTEYFVETTQPNEAIFIMITSTVGYAISVCDHTGWNPATHPHTRQGEIYAIRIG